MNKKIIPRCTNPECNAVFLDEKWIELSKDDWTKKIVMDGTISLKNTLCPNCKEYETMGTAQFVGWNPS